MAEDTNERGNEWEIERAEMRVRVPFVSFVHLLTLLGFFSLFLKGAYRAP